MEELNNLRVIANIEAAEILEDRTHRRLFQRLNAFEILSDRQFVKMFRLTKDLARTLLNVLDNFLEAPSRQGALDKQIRVLIALHFFATGSYQIDVGYNLFCGVSRASVSRSITEVVSALNQPDVFNAWVQFPRTLQDLENIRLEFYQKFGIPGIIGVIDCTHVAIFPPSANDEQFPEHIYINRKQYHSINVQLICDSKLKIMNVNARFPGSTHDAYIWNQSQVEETVRHINRRHPDFFLIGDSGYPLRPWLQTPLRNPVPNTPEYAYNETFKTARSIIERCNGVLKMRFRCLLKHRVLHYAPTKCSKIILACTVLHNMCIENNVEMPELEDVEIDFGMIHEGNEYEDIAAGKNADLNAGRNLQRKIIRNFFAQN